MKNLRLFTLFLILSLIASLMLFSCEKSCIDSNSDGKCDDCGKAMPGATPEEPEMPEEPITDETVLISNGNAEFCFVVQNNASSATIKLVDNLIKQLKNLNVETKRIFESEDNAADCEVIIDIPKYRGDAYEYDVHTLGKEGYFIKLIDGKVLIAGGSADALEQAIEVFTEDFLGIDKKTKELTDVKITEKQNVEIIQDDYKISSVNVNGNPIDDYTIATDLQNSYTYTTAEAVQDIFYTYAGKWLPIVPIVQADKSIIINLNENTYEGDGYSFKVEDDCLIFDIEFPNLIKDKITDFFALNVSVATGDVDFTSELNFSENVRDIYYSDFKAVGDGINDDFLEMKACHDYANEWGHTVKADKGKTYYIGKENEGETIKIRTDVDWQNVRIIIDDSHIDASETKLREGSVFTVVSDTSYKTVSDKFVGKSLKIGDTNIGFAPGYASLIQIYNADVKHYIRYGVNENSGSDQTEVLLVDADGNIDPSTPIIWNYEKITRALLFCTDDRPVTIKNAVADTIANQAENLYNQYSRNLLVTRSHTTIENIDHSMKNEGETRAPYAGFFRVHHAYDVNIKNAKAQSHASKYDQNTGAILGTYEFGAKWSVAVRWIGCTQKNFFGNNGEPVSRGLFGTNYCRNLHLEDCFLTSFDAHCGLTNVTIKNSTFEHMNFIGNGDIILENVNVYCANVQSCALTLRADYGSTWNGRVLIDGLCFKYAEDRYSISLIGASYSDWNFGYTCYFPEYISVKNVTSKKIVPTKKDSYRLEKEETVVAENAKEIHLCEKLEKYGESDISKFKDDGGSAEHGVYIGAKELHIENCVNISLWKLPNTPQFKDMKVYIDGVEVTDWKTKYGVTAEK